MNWPVFLSTFLGVFAGNFLWEILRPEKDTQDEC
jgi:hypothetical protein